MTYIFLANGFEEIEALTQIDYLRRAGIDIISVGIGADMIEGAHGIKVKADITIEEAGNDFDMLILPGGLGGVAGIEGSEKALSMIDDCIKSGKILGAICAAPTILAKRGYLGGKTAVCYPSMADEMHMCKNSGIGMRVVRDGNIITSIAAGASEEFSFALIDALLGEGVHEKVKAGIFAR